MPTHAGAYVDVEGLNPVEVELALNPTEKVYIHTPTAQVYIHLCSTAQAYIHIPMYVCMSVWYMYVCMYFVQT